MYVGRGRTHPSCYIGASLQQLLYPIQRGVAKIKIPTLVQLTLKIPLSAQTQYIEVFSIDLRINSEYLCIEQQLVGFCDGDGVFIERYELNFEEQYRLSLRKPAFDPRPACDTCERKSDTRTVFFSEHFLLPLSASFHRSSIVMYCTVLWQGPGG